MNIKRPLLTFRFTKQHSKRKHGTSTTYFQKKKKKCARTKVYEHEKDCEYFGESITSPDPSELLKHPSVLEEELPRLHWHRYYPDDLPEARACWYCSVVHRTSAEQRKKTRKSVSAWIKASSESNTLWMDKRAQVICK